ncbi:MAG: 4'-phosphopantetheinyl transferase superfamily protein [Chloroflexi bacterium]|nr:4'-phosphopantetheinyl transferase superfamily protein [Chloroflexota bacterium]
MDCTTLYHTHIDVWRAHSAACLDVLSPGERQRADRCLNEQARAQFVVGRAVLRWLLAALTGGPPRIETGPYGKPYLPAHPVVQFNLSHSAGHIVIAVDRGRAVGVDIEAVRPLPDAAALAEVAFSPAERAAAAADLDEFFTLWTRKEALLKAMGTGFASTEQIDVRRSPLYAGGNWWTLLGFNAESNVRGAAAAGGTRTLRLVHRRVTPHIEGINDGCPLSITAPSG